MPRHATDTSYGGKRGNKRGVSPITQAGNAERQYKKAMKRRTLQAENLRRLDKCLESTDDHVFMKAWTECADRGFGKPQGAIDLTSKGQAVPALLVVPAEEEPG